MATERRGGRGRAPLCARASRPFAWERVQLPSASSAPASESRSTRGTVSTQAPKEIARFGRDNREVVLGTEAREALRLHPRGPCA